MVRGPQASLFDLLDDWCGERFTTEVAARLGSMPSEQATSLADKLQPWQQDSPLPDRKPGELRVFLNPWGLSGGKDRPGRSAGSTMPALFLYAHQVVNPVNLALVLDEVISENPKLPPWRLPTLRTTLIKLAEDRDLVDAGAMLVVPWTDDKSVPVPSDLTDEDEIDVSDMEWISKEDMASAEFRAYIRISLGTLAAYDARRQLIESGRCATDIVFASRLSSQIFESFFSENARIARRSPHIERLMSCVLPTSMPSFRQIATLRREADEFASWRTSLADGLTATRALDGGPHWRAEARTILTERLAGAAHQLDKEVGRSAALSSLKESLSAFTIAGIGASAAQQVGGHLLPSAVSAATVGVGQLTREYLRIITANRLKKALLAHYFALVPHDGP